ncbi:MAG: DUF2867 domain-containing protein [Anaerolineales bacterium]
MMNATLPSILVTGATGYIGGRLVPRLLERGYQVRVFVRDAARLQGRPWKDQVEVVEGDVLHPEDLPKALQGIDAAYYLIHNMSEKKGYRQQEILAARNFSRAANAAGVQRILYLGGLGDPEDDLAPHLRSRQATGQELASHGVPVTEFRAAIIVGSGSMSFEMIRYLTERLPVMICPRWVYQQVQPIAVDDVLAYLTQALETPESVGKVIEIGGADVLPYADMMKTYARLRGLKRWLIPVPVLTPGLSSHWVHWMTPVSADLTRPLIEGLRNEIIVRNPSAEDIFPTISPRSYREAVEVALSKLDAGEVETRWTDALQSSRGDRPPVVLRNQEGLILEQREVLIDASEAEVFDIYTSLGGERGWLYLDWIWHIRGFIDRLLGGSGLRRGRRDPHHLRVGDAVDFWRVEEVHNPSLLRLRAEMILPGQAWLQFESKPTRDDQTRLLQTAFFAPKGLAGFLYWYLLYPAHRIGFLGLIRNIKKEAERG